MSLGNPEWSWPEDGNRSWTQEEIYERDEREYEEAEALRKEHKLDDRFTTM